MMRTKETGVYIIKQKEMKRAKDTGALHISFIFYGLILSRANLLLA